MNWVLVNDLLGTEWRCAWKLGPKFECDFLVSLDACNMYIVDGSSVENCRFSNVDWYVVNTFHSNCGLPLV